MMFGGSPISVDVPPILEAKICATKNGFTGTFNCLVILKVSGTVNNTVVTLSKNAEHIAVKKDNATNNFSGSAFTFLADQTAR